MVGSGRLEIAPLFWLKDMGVNEQIKGNHH